MCGAVDQSHVRAPLRGGAGRTHMAQRQSLLRRFSTNNSSGDPWSHVGIERQGEPARRSASGGRTGSAAGSAPGSNQVRRCRPRRWRPTSQIGKQSMRSSLYLCSSVSPKCVSSKRRLPASRLQVVRAAGIEPTLCKQKRILSPTHTSKILFFLTLFLTCRRVCKRVCNGRRLCGHRARRTGMAWRVGCSGANADRQKRRELWEVLRTFRIHPEDLQSHNFPVIQ